MNGERRKALRYLRTAMLVVALMLPLASLVVFGSVWLWQTGYLIYWALASCLLTLAIYGFERWQIGDVGSPATSVEKAAAPDAAWTEREAAAWREVERRAAGVTPGALTSRDEIVALGLGTVEAVAHCMHPKEQHPLWNFTVPEALAMVERVSARLRPFVMDSVPLGDRLTVGQVMKIYRWRGVIDIAEKAHDLWRVIRLLNPVTAVAHEVRESVTRRIYEWGREELARRLAEAYVREVGRAAIDLYSGRLRVSETELATTVTEATRADRAEAAAPAEPLRILVAGQGSSGKSSLINALSQEVQAAVDILPSTQHFPAYALRREGLPEALLIDSPGVTGEAEGRAALVGEAADADLVIWVTAADRPDREASRAALQAIRAHLAERTDRRSPPILHVLTHVDRLRPFQEWAPPYDLNDTERPKVVSMRAAIEAAATDLGVATDDIVPVSLASGAPYNIDVVWAKAVALAPEAQRTRLVRLLGAARASWDWRRLWSQSVNAGRVIVRSLQKPTPSG
jgi:predicted GTPase